MLKRQLGLLIISTLLCSTTLVHAAEIPEGTNVSVGNIRIQTSDRGEVSIQTPGVDINTTKVTVGRVSIDRNRRRNRKAPSMRRGRIIPSAAILRQQAIDKVNSVESPDRVGTSTTRTSTNDSHTVSEQNIQCSGSGSSITQSSQTINGRTVSSETRTNCN
jgi:hypothetical protein